MVQVLSSLCHGPSVTVFVCRAELLASDGRCAALRRIVQTLQTEMLHLYSQLHLDSLSGR